ncbi:hypothetical protein A8B78_15005 [Jannaschia sp. EhC01]|uniref:Secreted protein n=1 Tax=Gymnodinialimonas phycosphaerae TaxID=2841589 RepID=A0A975YGB0_9RHOB|nr:hypothetical protein [Gymnodinialimonas phycosphaerae]MBY4891366.1 hypothetical protein [Gymnodinialimonas phycosphaerae]OAN76798.1 hypothetical protein A8B78_15005 [Jannaschia sp. EhC01]
MPPFIRLAAPAIAFIAFLSPVQAFPQDGLFYQGFTCPVDGFVPGGERTASLSFPTLCLFEQCCDLSNPVNVRDMDQIFLYDGACTAEGSAFDARLLVGESSNDGIVVVLNNNAYTYTRCEP